MQTMKQTSALFTYQPSTSPKLAMKNPVFKANEHHQEWRINVTQRLTIRARDNDSKRMIDHTIGCVCSRHYRLLKQDAISSRRLPKPSSKAQRLNATSKTFLGVPFEG